MHILPAPKQLEMKEGKFTLPYDAHISISADLFSSLPSYLFNELKEDVRTYTGAEIEVTSSYYEEKGDILIRECKDEVTGKSAEAYEIQVSEEKIMVLAADVKGFRYAISTLRQMIREYGAKIPCVKICDMPDLPNRGFYHDVTRGRIPTLSSLKKLVDKMAYYKLNQLQLYVEHSFAFESESEVWMDDTPLRPSDMMELDAYAKERGVELIPSLSTFGHLYKVLETKTFGELCELTAERGNTYSFISRQEHHTLNISDEKAYKYAVDRIREYASCFSSKYINICADETFDLGKGKSAKLAKDIGTKEMYVNFVKRLCKFVISLGKIPMFWGDVIVGSPEKLSELPEETILLNWGYSANELEDNIKKVAETGAKQYACPGCCSWNEFVPLMPESYSNISRMCTYAHRNNAIGVLNTDWGDYGHVNDPEFSIPGMIYGAAFSWNKDIPEMDEVNKSISVIEFEDKTEKVAEIISKIGACEVFDWHETIWTIERGEDRIADKVTRESLTKGNESALELKDRLYEILPQLSEDARRRAAKYQFALDSIILFNRLGFIMLDIKERVYEEDVDDPVMASELEKWVEHFHRSWLKESRESEFYRVRDIVRFYAAMLRQG